MQKYFDIDERCLPAEAEQTFKAFFCHPNKSAA